MGASDARKGRRRDHDESHSVKPGSDRKRARTNRGRSEYRNVTRTTRRGPRDVEEEEREISEKEQGSESDSDAEEDAGDVDKGKAYDALLGLLSAEQEVDEEESESEEEQYGDQSAEEDEEDKVNEGEQDPIAGVVEEEVENDEAEEEFDSDSEDEDLSDPFEYHFANSSEQYLQDAIKTLDESNRWKNSKKTFDSHSCIVSHPPIESSTKYTKIPSNNSLDDYNIKQRVLEPFIIKNNGLEFVNTNDTAAKILDPMFSYNDVLYPYVSHKAKEDYRRLYALHAVNHIYKTRDRILKNNNKLHAQNEKVSSGELDPADEIEFRDQGFTRPKVLILLPTRHHCYQVVEEVMKISGVEQIENQKKFKTQFLDQDAIVPNNKPDDFRDLFEGNTNDFFCLGLKFTRKTLKLYSSFYNSDIILASPIGLQLILENPDKKKRQTDFLSSIEVFIIDQANAIELQNWDHVLTVLRYLNKIPEKLHDTDFGRVRMWSIEDQAKYFTQSLIFTEYSTPNINNLLTRSKNIFGKYRFRALVKNEKSGMSKVGLKIKQIFSRFESASPFTEPDDRFNHFKSVIVPSLAKSTSYEDGLLLYIPSYTDFLRIKNYLHNKTSLMFCDVNEYSEQKDLSRSRALFQQGRRKILLYTERLHHYRRFDLKGVKNILMYGVPNNPLFYPEIVSSIGRSAFDGIADIDISTVRCLYSKWDALALERIVGSERAPVLTHGQNEFYEFR